MAKKATNGKGKAKAAGATRKKNPKVADVKTSTPDGPNGDRRSDDAIRANFLQHRSSWNVWMSKKKAVEQIGKDVKAALKADGFLVEEMVVADALQAGPKKEAKIVGQVRTRLRVARWIGHAMGNQFDLFENASVAVERINPSDMGKQAAMEGQVAKPPEGLSQQQEQEWLAAFHVERDRMLREGIQKPDADGPAAGWGKSSAAEPLSA